MTQRWSLFVLPMVLVFVLTGCGLVDSLGDVQAIETKLKDEGFSNISIKSSSQTKNNVKSFTLTAAVDRPANPPFDQKLSTQVANIMMMSYPRITEVDSIIVELKGPGTASKLTHSLGEWRDLVRDYGDPPAVRNATLSKDVRGDELEPVDLTTDFPADQAVIHGVVTVSNLPQNTAVKAVWTAVDTHGKAAPNQKLAETEIKASGSQVLHFTVKPAGKLPSGTYKLDVFWADTLQRTLPFTMAGG